MCKFHSNVIFGHFHPARTQSVCSPNFQIIHHSRFSSQISPAARPPARHAVGERPARGAAPHPRPRGLQGLIRFDSVRLDTSAPSIHPDLISVSWFTAGGLLLRLAVRESGGRAAAGVPRGRRRGRGGAPAPAAPARGRAACLPRRRRAARPLQALLQGARRPPSSGSFVVRLALVAACDCVRD